MAAIQKNREIKVTSPLGDNVLLFYRMSGQESLSQPFAYELELLSEKDAIKPDKILGEPLTIHLQLDANTWRHFSGHVTRFAQFGNQGRLASYRATLRPWLWFLSRAANCRIFQHKTVPDIIKQVFRDQGFADFQERLTGSYSSRDYCVQYRESDLDFVSRLMEEEGIYYYFHHQQNKHELILCDSITAHDKVAGYEQIPFHQEQDVTDKEHIHAWEVAREVQTGFYAQTDYDFKKPKAGLLTKSSVTRPHSHAKYEWFDYPGEYTEMANGEQLARSRIEELQAQYECCAGSGNPRGLTVGSLFTLTEHPAKSCNREHLVLSAHYHLQLDDYLSSSTAGEGTLCECSFKAMDKNTPFRPTRNTPRPTVKGPQTAVVVGPSGEEIYVDKYGRVKIQFHWDRFGTNNENSSCWVRVSHPLAGKQWGMIAHPRIGQEVIVDFLEGDPDQPIITGRVYNNEQMPPYELPANATQSGIKSRSSKGGGASNFNELRFEDKKGSEQVFLHAEKNQDIEVENDESHWVGHDRSKTIDNDETTHVKHDRTETVDNNETITIGKNRTEDVGVNEAISIGSNQSISIGKNREESVAENEAINIGANRERAVGANETINIGKNQTLDIGEKRQTQIGKDDKTQVGKKFYLEAGDEITLKTGDASITMKKDGTIQIKGKDITIIGSGKINIKASGDMVLKGSKIAQN